jgi:hypothetical protein
MYFFTDELIRIRKRKARDYDNDNELEQPLKKQKVDTLLYKCLFIGIFVETYSNYVN